jgi:hypothetical protein
MKNPNVLVLFLILFLIQAVNAQQLISIKNPSFEGEPRRGFEFSKPIDGWMDCGLQQFPGESPPDIHPGLPPIWDVTTESVDGETYLGLVTRHNDTWESVSQRLNYYLFADSCYQISLWLCMSNEYKSHTSRSRSATEDFTTPIILQIYGGKLRDCEKRQLLASSPPVNHTGWMEYTFTFSPSERMHYIILEAFYDFPEDNIQSHQPEAYNGNILIDGLSGIQSLPCK